MPAISLDWSLLLLNLFKLGATFLLALPVAWQREKATRIMGMRTFTITAVACCAYILIAAGTLGLTSDVQARIIQGLMSGIGFLGAGAILQKKDAVQGTATAASIWMTGALGASVAYEQYELAILISLISYLILRFFTPMAEDRAEAE